MIKKRWLAVLLLFCAPAAAQKVTEGGLENRDWTVAGDWTFSGAATLNGTVLLGTKSVCLNDGTDCHAVETCDMQSGDAEAKIEGCLAAASSAGHGICDCRGLTGAQAIGAPINIDESNVVLLLGSVTIAPSTTINEIISVEGDNVTIRGLHPKVTRLNDDNDVLRSGDYGIHIDGAHDAIISHIGGTGPVEDYGPNGTATGGTGGTVMNDTGASWTDDIWIGRTIDNVTDGESCTITDNDATSITCDGLATATWDASDIYDIGGTANGTWIPEFIYATGDAQRPQVYFTEADRWYKCISFIDVRDAKGDKNVCDYTYSTALNCGGPLANRCAGVQFRDNTVTNACIENVDDGTVNTNCAGINSVQSSTDVISSFEIELNSVQSWGHGIKHIAQNEGEWTIRQNTIDNYDIWVLDLDQDGTGGQLYDGYGIFSEGDVGGQITDNYINYTYGAGIRVERGPKGTVIADNDINNAFAGDGSAGGAGIEIVVCDTAADRCKTGGDGVLEDIVVVANNCKDTATSSCTGTDDWPCQTMCVELDIDSTGVSADGCRIVGNGGFGLSAGSVVIDSAATNCYGSANGTDFVGNDPAATCNKGDIYLDLDGSTTATNCTGGSAGVARLCACTAADTWTGL